MNLNGKSFLTLLDFTPDEITGLLDLAAAVPIYHLACTPDRSAVDALAQALACSP